MSLMANQDPSSPNYLSPAGYAIPSDVLLTDDIYWYSQPYAVQKLRMTASTAPREGTANTFVVPTDQGRKSMAIALAANGYLIDPEIHYFGSNAVEAMVMRKNMGLSWVPSLNMSFQPTPLNPSPGFFSGSTPAGAITISIDPKDYFQKYPPPTIADAPPIPSGIIGKALGSFDPGIFPFMPNGGILFSPGLEAFHAQQQGMFSKNGDVLTINGTIYHVNIGHGPMGESIAFYIPLP